MIEGVGVDVVHVERFKRILDRWGDRFLKKVFSGRELELAEGVESLAVRFAAKEAFLKSLGLGLMKVPLKRIEVLGGRGRRPYISSPFKDIKFHVSLSHSAGVAIAVVIAER